jgi:ribosomal protein L32
MYQDMPEDINDIKRAWPVRTADVQAVFLNARIPMELQPPNNPTSFQSSHQVGSGSLDSTIHLLLLGASDDGCGVLGYSILIDQDPDSLPDRVLDRTEDGFTTLPLSPGAYYVHIRTVDQDGNWAEDVYTIGPFIISEGAMPEDEPMFPEGDTVQALIGLVIVLAAVGLMLILVVSQDKRHRPAAPPSNIAPSSNNCPYCGRSDLGGTYCSYCGGRLR